MVAYIFMRRPINWQNKHQFIVLRSSIKSEYYILYSGAQEAIWLHKLLIKLESRNITIIPISYNKK